ncbi:MAG TPA: ABC transporter permease [Bryobacteraceae bacterium]|nr:ABC transporter permease [Bryobacteraceae bacterium]
MTQVRLVGRRLARTPMFTFITLLTLAIGIGANSAIFSVINGVLLKPLPFDQPERLVGVWHTAPGLGFKQLNSSPSTYFTYKDETQTFEDSTVWQSSSVTITGLAEPERVQALYITSSFLPILRVQPTVGRAFTAQDDAPKGPNNVILTHAYWQRKFGGDRSAIGKRLLISGEAYEVIGVMPETFRFLDTTPAVLLPQQLDRTKAFVGGFSYQSFARLKPGATIEQANADVARMLPMMLNKFPMPPGFTVAMFNDARIGPNVHPLRDDVVGDVGKTLWVIAATVGIVLLIACANVANLLLVRADGRRQELAIRAALGADRGRLARELLGESITLGLIGGALGLGLAWAGLRLLVQINPGNLPRLNEITIDPLVLLFTLGISLIAGVLFGLIPAFKYGGPKLETALRQGGRSSSQGRERHRARSVLVVCQVAMALVLLISSVLMMRTFQELRKVEPGFKNPQEVLTLRISIPQGMVKDDGQATRMHQEILRRVSEVPQVVSAGLTTSVTMDGNTSNDPIFFEDYPTPEGQIAPLRRYKSVAPNYFHTIGRPIVAGRDFTWNDILNLTPTVILTENLVRVHYKDPNLAIGKRVRERPGGTWREIIGVVGNEHDDGADQKATAVAYWPIMQRDFWGQKIQTQRNLLYVVRSPRVGTPALLDDIRKAVWSVNPDLPLANVRTLEEIYKRSMGRTSFTLVMLAIAGIMAMLLGIVGIYGVISYSVAQRTREIGIRMALGAREESVRGMFVRHGLLLTGIGVAAGIGAAFALTRLMSSLLFGVSPLDPVTYVLVPIGLLGAAFVASYLPARRATVIDPVQALRSE